MCFEAPNSRAAILRFTAVPAPTYKRPLEPTSDIILKPHRRRTIAAHFLGEIRARLNHSNKLERQNPMKLESGLGGKRCRVLSDGAFPDEFAFIEDLIYPWIEG